MMWRRYHRWLALPFGLVLLWVAGTGIAMQVVEIYDKGLFGEDHDAPPAKTAATLIPAAQAHEHDDHDEDAPAAVRAPALTTSAGSAAVAPVLPRPPRSTAQQLHSLLQHLHSGEWFGPFGTIIQTLSGIALTFFTVSGMWMYYTMFRVRGRRERPGEPKWFW